MRIRRTASTDSDSRREEAKRLRDERAVLGTRFKVTKRRLKEEIQARWKDYTTQLMRTMRGAIAEEAKAQGYGAVLRRPMAIDAKGAAPGQPYDALVYAGGLHDLTDAVLRRMNRALRERTKPKRGSGAGPR